jgi:SAM-dependent methyltransferase
MMGSDLMRLTAEPVRILAGALGPIASFIKDDANISAETVESFGDEWEQFATFKDSELTDIGADYFDLVPESFLDGNRVALDVGCGSGRWTRLIAPRMKSVEAVDPSSAVFVAQKNCAHLGNVRVSQASVANLPFERESFDLVFSLGVLHHIPDTSAGIGSCVEMVRPGGLFLVYLYYSLDNRGWFFRAAFHVVNSARSVVSKLPQGIKRLVCDAIAVAVYLPMANLAKLAQSFCGTQAAERLPLNYYRKTRFQIMRNDSRDRFGTPLEQRFSKAQIHSMLEQAGLVDIQFSPKQPFWVAVGKKPESISTATN